MKRIELDQNQTRSEKVELRQLDFFWDPKTTTETFQFP